MGAAHLLYDPVVAWELIYRDILIIFFLELLVCLAFLRGGDLDIYVCLGGRFGHAGRDGLRIFRFRTVWYLD